MSLKFRLGRGRRSSLRPQCERLIAACCDASARLVSTSNAHSAFTLGVMHIEQVVNRVVKPTSKRLEKSAMMVFDAIGMCRL